MGMEIFHRLNCFPNRKLPVDLRLALYELAARHQLDSEAARKLRALSGLDAEPPQLERSIMKGIAMLGAFLGGSGIIFWIAANWDSLGRAGRFALLQVFFTASCLGAARLIQARAALAIVTFMTMGGLFAYFGQTYQTGADPWQLFASWSLLSLPLCFAVRSDALWTAWTWVTMVGISLWVMALSGGQWSPRSANAQVHLAAWGLAFTACALVGPFAVRATGAGKWSRRSAITLTTVMITLTGIADLFDGPIGTIYPLALTLVAAAAYFLTRPKLFDIFTLSSVGLLLDVLLVCLLARLLLQRLEIAGLVVLGLSAAAILGGTIHAIVSVNRDIKQQGKHQ